MYPLGLFDFELVCTDPGQTTSVTFYFDQTYDTAAWEWRKYDRNGQLYATMQDEVTYTTTQVGPSTVSTATYSLNDGGPLDEDGTVNSRILDPSGPAVAADGTIQDTGLSQTGIGSLLAIVAGFIILAGAYRVQQKEYEAISQE